MVKILFVCHGNICRSPMAEFVMKDLVKKAGLEDEFEIASGIFLNLLLDSHDLALSENLLQLF